MSRSLKPLPHTTLVRLFEADGFRFDRQKGSHQVLVKEGVGRPIIIPTYDEVGVPIIRTCMRTAGMSRERFFELLDSL